MREHRMARLRQAVLPAILGLALAVGFSTLTWAATSSPKNTVSSSENRGSVLAAKDLEAVREASEGSEAFTVTAAGPEARARRDAAHKEMLGAEGGMVPVARELDSGGLERGRVSYEGMQDTETPSPIVGEAGRTVGYWVNGLGWISVERATAPNFDPDEMLAESGRLEVSNTLPEGGG